MNSLYFILYLLALIAFASAVLVAASRSIPEKVWRVAIGIGLALLALVSTIIRARSLH